MRLLPPEARPSLVTLIFFALWLISKQVSANPYFDNNSNIRQAHQYMYMLCPVKVEKLLQAEDLKNPGNGYVTYYRLYNEIIKLIVYNSAEEFRKSKESIDNYIKTLAGMPDNNPDYGLLLGEAYVFSGLINIKYDNEVAGFISCLRGYNLLAESRQKYPEFEPYDKVLGIIEVGVAFLPRVLQAGAKLFSIKSDAKEGLVMLRRFTDFARGKPGYEEEALFFTLGAYRLMNQEEPAVDLIKKEMGRFKEDAALNFLAASVCLQANEAETALALLSNIAPEKLEINFPPLLFLKGKTKLLRLDNDTDAVLLNYLKTSSGSDFVKSTLYDLACFYYMSGNTAGYHEYIEKVKVEGREFLARDIEAAFEARKTELLEIHLMRADFLVRGGYFLQAEKELSYIANEGALKESEKVIYHYLRGECYRLRNNVRLAEAEYLNAVNGAKDSGSYIAQKALANSGLMMEENNLLKEAEGYYNSCLQFKADSNPYSDFYKNKARAGLMRLSQYGD